MNQKNGKVVDMFHLITFSAEAIEATLLVNRNPFCMKLLISKPVIRSTDDQSDYIRSD